MEDDVLVARGYLTRIFESIALLDTLGLTAPPVVSFCNMGFIGKLIRGGADLLSLAQLLRTFYAEMPCDWLISQ